MYFLSQINLPLISQNKFSVEQKFKYYKLKENQKKNENNKESEL